MKLQDENKNLKDKVLPNQFLIQIDQRDHHHVIPENGGKHHLTAQAGGRLDAAGYVPLPDDAKPCWWPPPRRAGRFRADRLWPGTLPERDAPGVTSANALSQQPPERPPEK